MEKRDKQTEGKPYKIVICGPESSGKSTTTKLLAEHFNTSFSEEFLREFAEELYSRGESLVFKDNLLIAVGQLVLEQKAKEKSMEGIYFCDTDLLQTMVYSEIYYSKIQDELRHDFEKHKGDLYLLLKPDIDWEYDVLRDKNVDRKLVYSMLKKLLEEYKLPYAEIEGHGDERIKAAVEFVSNFLDN